VPVPPVARQQTRRHARIDVSDGVTRLHGGRCPGHHYIVTDQVMHAGPSTHVFAEGVIAHSPSVYHGDCERVAVTQKHAIITPLIKKSTLDTSVLKNYRVEFDVYVEGDREDRC